MTRITLIIALLFGFLGFVAGNTFGFSAGSTDVSSGVQAQPRSPLLVAETREIPLAIGRFRDASFTYKGSGGVTLSKAADGKTLLRLKDFKSTAGPNLKVYLVQTSNVRKIEDVLSSTWVSLGQLKAISGDQTYEISPQLDVSGYGAVIIWCEQFNVLFSSATLSHAPA